MPFSSSKKVDLIIGNARIYTVDTDFSTAEAMAIKNGKIVAIGNSDKIKAEYSAKTYLDLDGKTVLPGLFDAHAHFLELGKSMQKADLTGAESFEEGLIRLQEFQKGKKSAFIQGHGWDQTLWKNPKFPDKTELDRLFPDISVAITRIDLHAMLVNQKAIDLAGIHPDSKVEGGEFLKENGKLTGILLDNAMDGITAILPELTKQEETDALLQAQEACFAYGLTNVADAAMTHEQIQLLNQLSLEKQLKIAIYPMLLSTDPHVDDYLFNGLGQNKGVSCRAIKVFGDGALGSGGSALKEPYTDDPDNYGQLRITPKSMANIAEKVVRSDFQLNTHAIGDAANQLVLKTYAKVLKNQSDRRWRIEHAQVLDPSDLMYFSKNIIPSVQPTHAISDMNWAEKRLGRERMKTSYANKTLLQQAEVLPLGTDAPVESINPFYTFHTAVTRQNKKGEPASGFYPEQKLTREEALRGMTIWAAYAQFEEKTKGSLEPGKRADFVILDRDIMQVDPHQLPDTKVLQTFIAGEAVYKSSSQK